MTPSQTALLNAIKKTWSHHPDWTLGKLLQSAMNVSRGEVRSNPAYATNAELKKHLVALIPEEDEGKKRRDVD